MNREKLRIEYFNETNGGYWINSQDEPDIDYVHWLEDKLINQTTFYCQQGMGIGGKDCEIQCEYCKE